MQSPVDFSHKMLSIEDLRFAPPRLTLDEVQRIAKDFYGVAGEFSALDGERDLNHRLRCFDGKQFVLKISGSTEPADVVEMQVQALCHIAQKDSQLPVPRMVANLEGRMISQVQSTAGQHAVRLLSWLPGQPYQQGPFPSPAGLQGLGGFIARLGLALQGFEHPASRHFMPWNIANGLVFSNQLRDLLPAELGNWLPARFKRLESVVFPQLLAQRMQVIHQDGHGANLLRGSEHDETVTGVIDFGDMIFGPLICDLAACVSDFMEAAADPVSAAVEITRGYHSILPLQNDELDLLLDLVMVRQIMVLQLFEFRRRNMEYPPDFVSRDQPGVIAMLQKLAGLDRQNFAQQLKEAVKHA